MNRKIKIQIGLICLLLLSSLEAGNSEDKKSAAEKHFQIAQEYYESGNSDSAMIHVKLALKHNRKMAAAHHLLALIHMDEGTVYGRFNATIAMEKAVKLEPDNLTYRFDEAMLNLKKGFDYQARRQFEKIIEQQPNHYQAYIQLAELKEAEMLHYQDMISIDLNSDGIIHFDKFARELLQDAADYYKKAISIRPANTEPYHRLALLYYEFENYNEMVQLLESAVKIEPKNKNAHLFLGFAYQNLEKYEFALAEYERAKSLMSESEWALLENIENILSPAQVNEFQHKNTAEKNRFVKRFWNKKEPFFLSEVNERKLEHFSRLAYVNLRFSKPDKNIEGWQTDRGKVFIRFGMPEYRYRTRPYIGEMMSGTRNPLVHSRELWLYPDFEFKFEDEYLSGNYKLARHIEPEFDYQLIYDEMIEEEPDYYQVFPDSMLFEVPLDIVAFKGEQGKTALEFCYAIPVSDVFPRYAELIDLEIKKGLFLFDSEWNPIHQLKAEVVVDQNRMFEIAGQPYFLYHDAAVSTPGQYNYALEFEDAISGKRSVNHQEVEVDTFSVDQLQMSDVLFAKKIQPLYTALSVKRTDFEIYPNPLRSFNVSEPVAIFYEIYNLQKNQDGDTRFSIEYQISADDKSYPIWKKMLSGIGLLKEKGQVATSYIYTGQNTTEVQYQHFKLDESIAGKVKLTINVTDLNADKRITKETIFTVIK